MRPTGTLSAQDGQLILQGNKLKPRRGCGNGRRRSLSDRDKQNALIPPHPAKSADKIFGNGRARFLRGLSLLK